jgi:cyclopropane-fatty-acyl-phospholipid synthase
MMNSSFRSSTLAPPSAAWRDTAPALARFASRPLERLAHGALDVQFPGGTLARFGRDQPHASIVVHRWRAFADLLARGDIGFAEAFVAGDWDTPDLPALLKLAVANRHELDGALHGTALGRLAALARHALNRNTRAGSRRNIRAHSDLGNAFYALWLDESMNYSSALFEGDATRTFAQAQAAKMRRVLREAGVREGSRVLEIGCGWGALAEMAAGEFGARVTGVTLSTEQLAYARQRVADAGVAPRSDLRLQDYRDIADGPYDAICSVEMCEAVGRAYWPAYFGQVASLLKPGGRACIQSIVIQDALWPRYIRGTDFIRRHIFPGGCLPCPSQFESHARAAGLEVETRFSFGADYARTLAIWRERFLARRGEVLALGFDQAFGRLWEFYLAYCEAAFAGGSTDVLQYTLRKRT